MMSSNLKPISEFVPITTSDSLKPSKSTTKQYGAIPMDDVAETNDTRCCHYSKPKRLLTFVALIIAFIVCITLRFGVYNNSDVDSVPNKLSLLPFCEKGPIGCSWNNNLLIFGGKAK
eukprot:377375_1